MSKVVEKKDAEAAVELVRGFARMMVPDFLRMVPDFLRMLDCLSIINDAAVAFFGHACNIIIDRGEPLSSPCQRLIVSSLA